MRVVGIGVGALFLLVGCSRENPWFLLATAGAAEATEVSASEVGAETGESTDAQANTGTTSGDPSDTDLPGTASGPASTDTTAMSSDPDTASTTSTTSTASTAMGSTDSGETGTSGESASTGEPDPGESVLYDLLMRCPFVDTSWLAGNGMGPPLACKTGAVAPWVGPEDYVHDGELVKALGLFPFAEANAAITGEYHKLNLQKTTSPRLRALLVYPPGGDGGKLTGHLHVEFAGEKVVPNSAAEIQLLSGQVHAFDVDLDLPEIKANAEVTLVMVVQVDSPAADIGGVWIAPRIVETAP